MQSNQFQLINIAGGSGGTYRLRRDGTLSLRAVRALENAPWRGWHFSGPAAGAALAQWEWLRHEADYAGLRPIEFAEGAR